MSGRIRRSFHLYGESLSLVPFLPFSLISSLQSSCNSCCHRRGWWGAKDVCGSQGAPRWGRVPDKVTATKRCSPSSSSFSSSSLCLSILRFFVHCSYSLVSFFSSRGILCLSYLFLFLFCRASSQTSLFPAPALRCSGHLEAYVASSNAFGITIDCFVRYFSPSTSSLSSASRDYVP